ncbi:peptide chain release factor N(5)-glutamine methyltransferase [Candidatus Thioglobus autotrophicus]|uniref:peptide chain release factor N(5)-glutamine methyltransferase n=1 Tax=Candidatus Thioglobus autotrophicus TaxID=1705394 RepID=UPI00299EF5C2|nr:peptide chain release factor N(5)-glutamine methyltransferase [Candidatus Thioglobus autotrophicus]WPE16867.1 peptide chain release factor N(5)-glutamine methyltransferase [Candidatus Thioglobus autotrophicus]
MKTVQDYLKSGAIDIAPLLSLVLEKSGAELISNNHYQLSLDEKSRLESFILKRQKGMPFAYLSGNRGFYHLDFKVTPDTLIPRPETELLIDIALELPYSNQDLKVLDLGTGSGIIAITLADKNPHWQVSATDYSAQALEVAKSNATTQIEFLQGSWFEPVADQTFDLIISNPPYIEENDSYLDDLSFEPISALTAGKDGLDDIRIIINQAPNHLENNGFLLLEHGHNQQARIVELLTENFTHIQTFKDYNSKDRAVLAQVKN